MAKFRGAVVVDKEKCKGCNLCVVACPTKTLDLAKEVNGKGYHYSEMVNPEASENHPHAGRYPPCRGRTPGSPLRFR